MCVCVCVCVCVRVCVCACVRVWIHTHTHTHTHSTQEKARQAHAARCADSGGDEEGRGEGGYGYKHASQELLQCLLQRSYSHVLRPAPTELDRILSRKVLAQLREGAMMRRLMQEFREELAAALNTLATH